MNADPLSTKDLLDFYFRCSDSMQTFWNFYITVVLGLVAFFASVKLPKRPLALVITTAFIVFAIVNLSGLHDLTLQRLTGAGQVKRNADPREEGAKDDPLAKLFAGTLHPPEFWQVANLHITIDIITITTIWLLVLRKTKGQTNVAASHSHASAEIHDEPAPLVAVAAAAKGKE